MAICLEEEEKLVTWFPFLGGPITHPPISDLTTHPLLKEVVYVEHTVRNGDLMIRV